MFNRYQCVLFGSKDAIEAFDTSGAEGLDDHGSITDWEAKRYNTDQTIMMMAECGKWDEFMFISEEEYNEIKEL